MKVTEKLTEGRTTLHLYRRKLETVMNTNIKQLPSLDTQKENENEKYSKTIPEYLEGGALILRFGNSLQLQAARRGGGNKGQTGAEFFRKVSKCLLVVKVTCFVVLEVYCHLLLCRSVFISYPVCLSINLCKIFYLFIYLSIYQCIDIFICLYVCLCLSVCMCVCVYMSVCVSVFICPSVFLIK